MSIERIISIVVWFVIGTLLGHIVSMLMNLKQQKKDEERFNKEFGEAVQQLFHANIRKDFIDAYNKNVTDDPTYMKKKEDASD